MRSVIGLAVGAALIICAFDVAAAEAPADGVAPPFDVEALRLRFGADAPSGFTCPEVPPPVASVAIESKYAPGSDSSEIDPERLEAYQELAARLKDFAGPLTRMANDFVRSRPADARIAQCGSAWLVAWARARALEAPADRKGESVRAWNLPPIALAYLQFRDSDSLPEEDRIVIEAWIDRLGTRVMTDFSAGADLPSRRNNHRYWAGWAVMTAAAVLDDRAMFDWALESARVGLRAVTPEGFLPLELERGKRALGYHVFAAEALVMLAAMAEANGIDLFDEEGGALRRLTAATLAGLSDSSPFEKAAATPQDVDFDTTGTKLAWVKILSREVSSSSADYLAGRLTNAVSLAAGGDIGLLYPPDAPGPSTASAEVERATAAALGVADPAMRQAALLAALAEFDHLSVFAPDDVKAFDVTTLVRHTAETIIEHARLMTPDDPAFEESLAALRDVMPRVREPVNQIDLYAQLAELESRSDPAAALATVVKISARIAALPEGEDRDRLRSTVVRLALAMPGVSIETITRWAVSIEHPRLRSVALRAVALARIAAGEVNKDLFRAVAIANPAERTAALVDLAAGYAAERRFQTALFAALALGDEAVAERDKMLAAIFAAQVAVNFRPDAIYAPFAMTEGSAREALLAEFAEYSVRRSRLSLARDVAAMIDGPQPAFRAWVAIAAHAREQSFTRPFADAFARARSAAERIEDPGQRREAMRGLAVEAVEAGDEAAALETAAGLDDKAFAEMLTTRIALKLVATGDAEGAAERLGLIADPANKSAIASALFRYYLGKGRSDDATGLAGLVTTPADRIRMLVAEVELVFANERHAGYQPSAAADRLAEAERVLAEIVDPVEHQELAVLLAVAFGKLGDISAVTRLTDQAPSDEEHDALRPVLLGILARLDDPEKALAQADRSFDTGLQSRELSEIAKAQFERGDAAGALATAQNIPSERIRVTLFRALAESHMAASRDASVELGASVGVGDEGGLAGDHTPRFLGRHVMQSIDGSALGRARPDLPPITGINGKTVRQMVPVVAPGRAMVIPTGFSNFNEKFSYIRYLNSLDFVGDDENVFARGQRTLFPSFIMVESGVFDLPTLKTWIEQDGGVGNYLTSDGRVYQLNVPLLIGSDATLLITSADVEELRLNTAANAYIVNSGRLFLVGSTLTSWDPGPGAPTPRSKQDWLDFNAFYVGWSGSETYVADAHVNGLGYGNGKSYGFVLSSGPENVLRATSNAVAKPTGIIVDSLFTDMYYGFYSYEADNVSVVGNAYSDNTIYAIDPHDWSENLTFAFNTTLNTHTKHGIVTSREVRHSNIIGNITSGNAGSGILLDRTSNDNVVAYNLSIGNKGDGLTLYESSCNLVYRNTFVANARAGVRIRNSADILLSDNTIGGNADVGLSVYAARLEDDPRQASRDLVLDPYHAYADVTAAHNNIIGNARGAVDAELVSAMVLAGNRLSGDAGTILRGFALGDAGPVALSLASTGVGVRDACRPVRPSGGCIFRDKGYLGEDVVGALEAAARPDAARCPPGTASAGDGAPGLRVAGSGR